jgi:uncharacterized OB-fold protein
MRTLTGAVEMKMQMEEVQYLNHLIRRDRAVPAIDIGVEGSVKCPVCGDVIPSRQKFCESCGQRIDTENYAL